jgi:hypothetical protein
MKSSAPVDGITGFITHTAMENWFPLRRILTANVCLGRLTPLTFTAIVETR